MEIEFYYIRRITGLLAAHSKSEATKKVRETGRFTVREVEDHDAPVAYRELGRDGEVISETRWFDGSHWHVTDSVPPTDGTGMAVGIPDFDLMYGDLVKPADNISHGGSVHGFVGRDKTWFRVASDDADSAYENAEKHFTGNTAVIGGKFAFRVLEPSLKFSFHGMGGPGPYEAHLTVAPRATVESRRWHHAYGLSFHEYAEAMDDLITAANLGAPIKRCGSVDGLRILIPEAFSMTLVEPATRRVIEDGLSLGERCLGEFDLRSKVAFAVLRDSISREGRLTVDCSTALARFGEFGSVLREARMKKGQVQNMLLSYVDLDLRVARERFDEMQSVNQLYEATRPEPLVS